jgi:hypothetical protein
MISRAALSTVVQGQPKYRSMLAGNAAFIPTSFESIATFTGTGTGDQISFTSIPSTYKHLQLRIIAKDVFVGGSAQATTGTMIFNSDGTSLYNYHNMQGNGASALTEGTASQTSMQPYMLTYGPATNIYGVTILDILDYASTTKFKTVRSFSGANGNAANDGWTVRRISGLYRSTNAINSITFATLISGFATGTVFSLYGIKG